MNISCRIANANTQCGRITNPPERADCKHLYIKRLQSFFYAGVVSVLVFLVLLKQ